MVVCQVGRYTKKVEKKIIKGTHKAIGTGKSITSHIHIRCPKKKIDQKVVIMSFMTFELGFLPFFI